MCKKNKRTKNVMERKTNAREKGRRGEKEKDRKKRK